MIGPEAGRKADGNCADMILVFGSINIDLSANVPAIPRPGETVLSECYQVSPGGKGANQAVAAARARDDAGLAVFMAGSVGDDVFGDLAILNLVTNGVDVSAVRKSTEPTGCAFITVDRNGENAITVASGANRMVCADDVPRAMLRQAKLVTLQMEIPIDENIKLAREARRAGARVLLNCAPASPGLPRAALASLLENVDLLVVNELEAAAIVDIYGGGATAQPTMIARRLGERAGVTAIITLGRDGAVASERGVEPLESKALPVEPIDTTGAGDTFVGVLACRLVVGDDLKSALRRACVAASLACLDRGAQSSMPRSVEIERALARGA